MALLFKKTKKIIRDIDEYINTVEQGVLVFRGGVTDYLNHNKSGFEDKLKTIDALESDADKLQRRIDDEFYRHSLLPQNIGDIENMLDRLDEIIDICKDNLYQFEVEIPSVPADLRDLYIQLADTSVEAALSVIPAVRVFFREPVKARDMLSKVYFYEKETDRLARSIKRKLFHDRPEMELAQKIHLRYFALHIEIISDKSEALADALSIMSLKLSV